MKKMHSVWELISDRVGLACTNPWGSLSGTDGRGVGYTYVCFPTDQLYLSAIRMASHSGCPLFTLPVKENLDEHFGSLE